MVWVFYCHLKGTSRGYNLKEQEQDVSTHNQRGQRERYLSHVW